MNRLEWFVAHTRPRREKKLARYCEQEGIRVTLPCYRATHKYVRKVVAFEKPLFPGYVFLQLQEGEKQKIFQRDDVANLLVVHDQEHFARQLTEILTALESKVEVFLAPLIGVGTKVRVKYGPLRGLEGQVEERYGMTTVLLRLDFIGQAAAVKLAADELELI
ncbi:MAG TPA: transcription termination/antitermination NusG family protein [Verrucomicrobiae bacterium]|nr:transcription termination/antitermination NusG family protein [Verrucomicrobiae bacterium]